MTRKKAIDRALLALPLSNHGFYREVLENLWTDARIAGVRECVQVLRNRAGSASWFEQEKLRDHANQMTKKARSK